MNDSLFTISENAPITLLQRLWRLQRDRLLITKYFENGTSPSEHHKVVEAWENLNYLLTHVEDV